MLVNVIDAAYVKNSSRCSEEQMMNRENGTPSKITWFWLRVICYVFPLIIKQL